MKSKPSTFPARASMPGFTLVELMVVVVIIIVLAAMVFLGTSRLKEATNRTVSMDNLKKLQLANGLYATDNNGRFAACYTRNSEGKTGGLWDRNPDFLDNFVGPNLPTVRNRVESRVGPKYLDPIAYAARASGYDTLKASYGMISKLNYTSSGPDSNSSYRLTELATPARTASFVTSVNWLVQYSGRRGWNGEEGKVNAPRIAYRHRNKALVAFYDGHVEVISQEDIAEFDRRGGKNNSFWSGTSGRP